MDFRRSGQRDERRRRVLLEETGGDASTQEAQGESGEAAVPRPATERVRHYTDAALSPRQPRVIDLIPKRRWTNLVLFLLVMSCATAAEAVYGYVALQLAPHAISRYAAIDLAVRGSVATWLTAAFLGVSAVLGALTYQLRRYRVDDYRGRYRMWYWMVPVLMLASVDCVAGIQQTVRTALLDYAGIPEYADACLIWTASMAVILGAIGLRLAIEMRACRLAVCCLLLALSCFAAVGAAQLNWILPGQGVFQTMASSSLVLGGHIALLMALCLNARHVYRDACGEIVTKPARVRTKVRRSGKSPRGAAGTAAGSSTLSVTRRHKDKVLRKDPPHTSRGEPTPAVTRENAATTQPPARKEKRRVAAEVTVDQRCGGAPCTPDDDHLEDSARLSKAERRRLRKLQRRDRP